jgi:pyridoxamine 5'-phosphate oxidase
MSTPETTRNGLSIADLRREYSLAGLREKELDSDPFRQFEVWFREAMEAHVYETNAMTLATATKTGRPSARIVLLKGVDDRGFVFYTNYASRKGGELEANPRAALLFHWPELGRQVRAEGPVERVTREESESYARSRAPGSRLSALASPQSRPVPSREWLEERVAELAREPDAPAVGDEWGGYRLAPDAWEFWQHRPDRLHDRFRYLPAEPGGWLIERLGP